VKVKFFYGWYIVIAGLVLSAYYSSMFVYGWTTFVNPVMATFGWSMAQISLASSLRGLETGVFNPVWGAIVDRWSPRKLMLLGVITTASGILLLSQTRNLAMYYGGFLLSGLGSSLVTGILPVTVIARWFSKDMGKATGLFYMGVGAGGVAAPLVVRLIDRLQWQTTLLYGAIGFLVLGVPLSFVIRSRPADYGLLPDGRATDAAAGSRRSPAHDFGTSAKEALKTRAFWHLVVTVLFQMASNSTVSLYVMPYLTSMGMSRALASTVVMMFTLSSLFTRIPMGMLADIFKKKYVLALSVGLQGIGVLVLWLINGSSPFWMLVLFGVVYGFGLSGLNPLRPPILVEYFGTRNFGTIFGLEGVFVTMASVVSQPLAGWVYDTQHDYKIWWLAMVLFALFALVVIMTIPRPQRRAEPATTQTAPQAE
jgi:MFS family permease